MLRCLISSASRNLKVFSRNYAIGADFLKNVPLKNRQGALSATDIDDKAILLYFSSGWCGYCKLFTPKLKKWYENAAKNEGIEIVWVSRDRAADHQVEYYEKNLPNVPYIPFGDPHIQEFLAKYQVQTIPTARLVNSEGKIVEMDARIKIENEGQSNGAGLAVKFKKLV